MKDDWLTIPDAPNYEINSDLVCRNKRTGKILRPMRETPSSMSYNLFVDGRNLRRTARFFRVIAEEAVTPSEFLPVPSLDYRYEINEKGVLRFIPTRRPVKPTDKNCYVILSATGHRIGVSRNNLLLEVFGKAPSDNRLRVPVIISKGNQKLFFDTKTACAEYLSPKVFLGKNTVYTYLSGRRPEIEGWKINYLEDDRNCYGKELSDEARRMRTLDKKAGLTC